MSSQLAQEVGALLSALLQSGGARECFVALGKAEENFAKQVLGQIVELNLNGLSLISVSTPVTFHPGGRYTLLKQHTEDGWIDRSTTAALVDAHARYEQLAGRYFPSGQMALSIELPINLLNVDSTPEDTKVARISLPSCCWEILSRLTTRDAAGTALRHILFPNGANAEHWDLHAQFISSLLDRGDIADTAFNRLRTALTAIRQNSRDYQPCTTVLPMPNLLSGERMLSGRNGSVLVVTQARLPEKEIDKLKDLVDSAAADFQTLSAFLQATRARSRAQEFKEAKEGDHLPHRDDRANIVDALDRDTKKNTVWWGRSLVALLALSERLCSETIEQKRLRFTLWLSSERSVDHALRVGTLAVVTRLSLDDFAMQIPTVLTRSSVDDYVRRLGDSIVGNAYFLQGPATCLLFRPDPSGLPVPYCLADVEGKIEDKAIVRLHIENGSVEVEAATIQLGRYERTEGQWVATADSDEQFLKTVVGRFSGLHKKKDKETLTGALIELRRTRHGGLIYLVPTGKISDVAALERLGRPWSIVDGKRLEEVSDKYLARLIAMDGETILDPQTTKVSGRFLAVPTKLPKILTEDGAVDAQFEGEWQTVATAVGCAFEFKGEPMSGNIDSISEMTRYGTRHRKAMMMSRLLGGCYALITVSSDGPVRVWVNGLPVLVRR